MPNQESNGNDNDKKLEISTVPFSLLNCLDNKKRSNLW